MAAGMAALERISAGTPRDTGNLANALLHGELRKGGGSGAAGVLTFAIGNERRIGNPNRAPRGTIKAFLRDHPEFRRSKRARTSGFRSSQAWWMLSKRAKEVLQRERLAGKYGGGYLGVGSSKAGYFYAQEGSRPEWEASAQAAGITPTYFVTKAMIEWRNRDLPVITQAYIERVFGR